MRKRLLLFLLLGTLFTLASCETVVTPMEQPDIYNVIYYIEEGNAYNAQSYEESEFIVAPESPIKESFIFEYWTLNSTEFDFAVAIQSDLTLYAQWIEETQDITLYNGDVLIEKLVVDTYSNLSSLDQYRSAESNDTFVGWYLDQELTSEFDTTTSVVTDLILYGKWNPEEVDPENDLVVTEDGLYISRDEVALYIATFHKLPSNYMTKAEADGHISSIWTPSNKASIGGDVFGNREGLLPYKAGRTFIELDIDYNGGSRGAKRIVYSNDFRIFYTADHYDSFVEYDKETREWKSY